MNEYAWHYLNLSMDNTSRCHIYLFPSACIQGSVRVGFSQIKSKCHPHLHHVIHDLATIKSLFISHTTSMCPETPPASNQLTVLIRTGVFVRGWLEVGGLVSRPWASLTVGRMLYPHFQGNQLFYFVVIKEKR